MFHPALLVVLACLLDRLVGDPRRCLHPVQVMGWTIQRLRTLSEAWAGDTPWKLRLAGGGLTLVVVAGSGLTGWLLETMAREMPLLGTPLLLVALASALAGRSLEQAVRNVLSALPDLAEARSRLGWIVGRNVQDLPEGEILRAAAETTAENAVDGLFAPLFWMLVGAAVVAHWTWAPGPLALAWIFKASSTLDSMLGYRQGRLRWLGTAGARLDDGLTWLPARLWPSPCLPSAPPLSAGCVSFRPRCGKGLPIPPPTRAYPRRPMRTPWGCSWEEGIATPMAGAKNLCWALGFRLQMRPPWRRCWLSPWGCRGLG